MTVMLPTLSPAFLYGLLFILVSLLAAFGSGRAEIKEEGYSRTRKTPLSIWLAFASVLCGLLAFLCIGGAAIDSLRLTFHP